MIEMPGRRRTTARSPATACDLGYTPELHDTLSAALPFHPEPRPC